MPELYAKIDTPRGWTGELDRHPCQQVLLHGNQWQETTKKTNKMHDSSGWGNHGVVQGWHSDSLSDTPWVQSIQLNLDTTGKVPYRRGMWPMDGKGSFAVCAWVLSGYTVGDVPLIGNKFSGNTEDRLFEVYSSRVSGTANPYLCATLYSKEDGTAASLRVKSMELTPYVWTLICLSVNYDTNIAKLEFYKMSGGGGSDTISLTPSLRSKLNLTPRCSFVLGGGHFGATFEEVVLYNPIPAGPSPMELSLACKDATGGANPPRINIVFSQLDSQEPNAMDGGSDNLPVGRAAPSSVAVIGESSAEFATRWVPLKRFPAVPGARILVEGKDVKVGARTTDALDRLFNSTFSFSVNNKGYPTVTVSNANKDKWIQFKVVYKNRSGYVDSLHVVRDHNNDYFASTHLPKNHPVPAFQQSPILVHTKDGGLILEEELLRCITVDTDDLESTLEFDLPLWHPKSERINLEDRIEFRDRLYVVRAVTRKDSSAEPKLKVYCERSWYDLLYAGEISKLDWGLTAEESAMLILADCEWSLGMVDDPTAQHRWKLPAATTRVGALKELAKQYHLELSINEHDKIIHLLKQAGRDAGVTFFYEKEVATATRQVDTTNLLTRIYGINEIDGDISPVNNGVPYLEDKTWSQTVRQMTYHFSGAQTPAAMKAFMQTYLKTRSQPRISYEFELAALGNRFAPDQAFEVNDWVAVRDENLNQIVKTKVVEAHIDWINLDSSRVTLDSKLDTLSTKI